MSTYIKPGKSLEFDNAPDWLVAYMRYRRTMLGNTPKAVITDFITVREYLQWLSVYKRTGQAPKTKDALRKVDILDLSLNIVVSAMRNDIETYLFFCADTLGNKEVTRTKKLTQIRCMYNYLLDQSEVLQISLAGNPADRIKTPKKPKKQPIYLQKDEISALLNAVEGENAIRDYAILLLTLDCGLRVSEVVGLTMQDVNLQNQTIRIHGKGNKERISYLLPPCVEALSGYLYIYREAASQEKGPNAPFFIAKRTGAGITTRTVERLMQKHSLAAGIGGMGYTPHKLRHTFASLLAKEGVSSLVIRDLLGHESTETTQIYTHLTNGDLENAIKNSSLMRLGEFDDESYQEGVSNKN